ncbi:MAG TPA: DCC1-like thiol-disulfide oxidoreductase family protein [Paenisporosarcina sp.]|nr:DCC1-like thiol-disulfide oxidoreductase family protein [Paenisporosarcina sp.]
MNTKSPVLFYDGSCGFCQQSVQFILQHERAEEIHFAALDSELANQLKKQHPKLQSIDSIVVLKGKELLVESDAVFALTTYLKAPYHFAKYARFIPKTFLNFVYRFVAKHRHRFIRQNEACLLPSPQQRKRFLH